MFILKGDDYFMFCNYCGYKNPDDSYFCSKCGKKLISKSTELQFDDNIKIHTVEIFRESQMFLINPPINISIEGVNGKKYLSIENGKTINLQLVEGKYEFIFFQSIRKRTLSINLNQNIHINLRWNRITGSIEANILE